MTWRALDLTANLLRERGLDVVAVWTPDEGLAPQTVYVRWQKTTTAAERAEADPTRRNTGKREVVQSKVFTFDDEHERVRWLRADMQTGTGLVQRRLAAEREGYTIKTFHSPDDLPGHARTKFDLMEWAANVGNES